MQNALELRRCQYSSWKGFLLLALLSVVLGIVMVVNPFGAMETLVMAIGVILIVEGALNLLSAAYTAFAVRRFMKMHPEAQSVLEAVTGQDLNGDGWLAPNVTRRMRRQSRGVGYGGRERRGGDPPGGVMSRAAVCTA